MSWPPPSARRRGPRPARGDARRAEPRPEPAGLTAAEVSRALAVSAIAEVADILGVEPAGLSMRAYRSVRDDAQAHLPPAQAISALFGGWQRASEQAAARSTTV